MRFLLATIMFAIVLGASAAQAEKRIFIVANNADGYGVDRCLATGASLRHGRGDRLLQITRFVQASSYRQIDKDEITGAIPANAGGCKGGTCEHSSRSSARARSRSFLNLARRPTLVAHLQDSGTPSFD